ncbi:MAG: DUF47 family protein [Methanomicrobiales archaeon]|nr:DUF47 family protein [Methanomicrobiales archaeon]
MGLREWLVPHDEEFFDLFDALASQIKLGADHLVCVFTDYTDISQKAIQMKEIETQADQTTHKVYDLLKDSFTTPFEPDEISKLAKAFDDVIDYMHDTCLHLDEYNIEATDTYMVEMATLVQKCAIELQSAVSLLRNIKYQTEISTHCIEVNRLENEVDVIRGRALKELFLSSDPIRIIKYKEVYEDLEMAADKCESAANVLSDMTIRHA